MCQQEALQYTFTTADSTQSSFYLMLAAVSHAVAISEINWNISGKFLAPSALPTQLAPTPTPTHSIYASNTPSPSVSPIPSVSVWPPRSCNAAAGAGSASYIGLNAVSGSYTGNTLSGGFRSGPWGVTITGSLLHCNTGGNPVLESFSTAGGQWWVARLCASALFVWQVFPRLVIVAVLLSFWL